MKTKASSTPGNGRGGAGANLNYPKTRYWLTKLEMLLLTPKKKMMVKAKENLNY